MNLIKNFNLPVSMLKSVLDNSGRDRGEKPNPTCHEAMRVEK